MLQNVVRIFNKLDEFQQAYEEVKRWTLPLHHVTDILTNFVSYTKGFWKGMFTCYDYPHVPRTNNDHERFFRQTKTRHRRMTGRQKLE